MKWKIIGKSVLGTSHVKSGKECEDALEFAIVKDNTDTEVFVCCASDGAGSALYAKEASRHTCKTIVKEITQVITNVNSIADDVVLKILEKVFDDLSAKANELSVPLNEFSCTCLLAIVFEREAFFYQIGDGVIIRDDSAGNFTPVFWPHNDEYLNSTSFIIDNVNFPHLRTSHVTGAINEISVTTDGLQGLTLNNETQSVHQPFFSELFKWLRMAQNSDHLDILGSKLEQYLNSDPINNRTDDDKTLLLATRIENE